MVGAANITSSASTVADRNGEVTIEALRYFADASVPDTLDFGAVRAYTTGTKSLAVSNGVVVSAISDKLVTTLGTSSSALISGTAPGQLAAGQTGAIIYTLNAQSGPGIVSESVTLGFSSHAAGGDDFALGSKTVAVTGTVTDYAIGFLLSSGAGQMTQDEVTGYYVLYLGDVAAGSKALAQLIAYNGVTASAYSESLGGIFGALDGDGFSFTNAGFDNLGGGAQVGIGPVKFDSAGLSLGLHSQTLQYVMVSRFAGLDDYDFGLLDLTVVANIIGAPPIAGVPEPATWGLMLGGFGMIGAAMRRRKRQVA
ncbi:hypothetical protein GCM10011529_31340 [Polymorphobacter glacialis]|uniref:Ice-binding protein C-terminal domain-containing protein n=1 Tax=Sandarakinorhabdus glacialis TaxID=1614636 RepID=A0A917A2T8_9SPHN|nr:PEPxxWA-CTERM sorting domain-containing protein [Polymorphobacter glacialis]GGE22492.1 hypothetical protein GCM10011529_31340 [Polymorphobacter glacialis]